MPKPHSPLQPKTGDDYINKAKSLGALVEPSKKRGFTKISTPKGSMYLTPGNQPLDPRTRKNYNHWFRLLGLLALGILALPLVDFLLNLIGYHIVW
jgi:hypothetical protein